MDATLIQVRKEFRKAMKAEGLDIKAINLILNLADTYQRLAVEECNVPGVQVKCPNAKQAGTFCRLCEAHANNPADLKHETVRASTVYMDRIERKISANLPKGFAGVFNGDPRGSTVKIKVPSGRSNGWSNEGMCVPTRRY